MTEDDSRSIEGRLRNWLSSQGYPLELRTVQEFAEGGFVTHASRTYLDHESSVWREIDLLAWRDVPLDERYYVRVTFCIECKTSDKPWLLFRHSQGHLGDRAMVVQRFANEVGEQILRDIAADAADSLTLFRIDQPHAHNIAQAFTTGRDIAYEACLSASKASRYQASLNGQGMALISIPVVVTNGPLYYCSLSEDGQIELDLTPQGDLVWDRSFEESFAILKIISSQNLTSVIQDLSDKTDEFLEFSVAHKDRIISLFDQPPKDAVEREL